MFRPSLTVSVIGALIGPVFMGSDHQLRQLAATANMNHAVGSSPGHYHIHLSVKILKFMKSSNESNNNNAKLFVFIQKIKWKFLTFFGILFKSRHNVKQLAIKDN